MIRKRTTNRQGASVVEAAILLPFLMIVTFGSVDLSQYINTGQVIVNSSREGARAARRNSVKNISEIQNVITDYLTESLPGLTQEDISSHVKIEVMEVNNGSSGVTKKAVKDGDLANVDSGDPIAVLVEMDFKAVRWLPGAGYNKFKTETFCRRE